MTYETLSNGWLTDPQSSTENPPRRLGRQLTKPIVRMASLDNKYPELMSELPEKVYSAFQ